MTVTVVVLQVQDFKFVVYTIPFQGVVTWKIGKGSNLPQRHYREKGKEVL